MIDFRVFSRALLLHRPVRQHVFATHGQAMPLAHRRRRLCVFALILCLGLPAQALSSDSSAGTAFEVIGTYQLLIAGESVDDASFYQGLGNGSLVLIRSAELPSPVLLQLQSQEVAVPSGELPPEQADGTLVSPSDVEWVVQGKLRLDSGRPAFQLGETQASIDLAEALIGTFDAETLSAALPSFAKRAQAYKPDAELIEQLKALEKPLPVRVYFGSYCSRCSRYVPKMLSVHQDLAASRLDISYIGVGRSEEEKQELLARGFSILPVAVILDGEGQPLKQIPVTAWERPEQALLDVFRGTETAP